MGLFLSLFHPSDMFQKSVRCYLIMGAFLIWVPYGGFLWERFLLVGSFGKGVFWKRVLWKFYPNFSKSSAFPYSIILKYVDATLG